MDRIEEVIDKLGEVLVDLDLSYSSITDPNAVAAIANAETSIKAGVEFLKEAREHLLL